MRFEKDNRLLSLEEFAALTGARWNPSLDFDLKAFAKITKICRKLEKRGEFPIQQIWLGKYFEKELNSKSLPDLTIKWIDHELGWGVFAARNFKPMEFIAEYTGKVRKRQKIDEQNSYCFEYALTDAISSPYTIDAMEQGGVARYINHSQNPNLTPALANFDGIPHIVLHANRAIAKDEQLCYDYGPDYWSRRTKPIDI